MAYCDKYQEVINSEGILVYGAKMIAKEAIEALKMICPEKIIGCAVSNIQGNDPDLLGISVKEIDVYQVDKEKVCVLIAVGRQYYKDIKKSLLEKQYAKVYLFDSEIRNRMFKAMVREKLKQFMEIDKG